MGVECAGEYVHGDARQYSHNHYGLWCCPIPRGGAHDRSNPSESSSSSIFSSIMRQSSKALAATARGSTKIAADLVRPKEVDWEELVGWWRLDISLENANINDDTPPMTIQITRDGRVRYTDISTNKNMGKECSAAVEFRPASWPRSAKLKFSNKEQGLVYECTVQRKLANLEILKLRGKIYSMRRFQGKVQVGTFVGRRRMIIMDDDQDEEMDEEEDPKEYDDPEEDAWNSDVGVYDDDDDTEEAEEGGYVSGEE